MTHANNVCIVGFKYIYFVHMDGAVQISSQLSPTGSMLKASSNSYVESTDHLDVSAATRSEQTAEVISVCICM